MIKKRLIQLRSFFLTYLAFFVSLFRPRKEPFFLICERGNEARDNAYFFYLYLKQKYPEQRVRYLIRRSSPDYDRVAEDAVAYGSFAHYLAVVEAEMIVSTHAYLFLPEMFWRACRFLPIRAKIVFLQHGIIHQMLPFLYHSQMRLDLFISGARPEYELLTSSYGYPEGVIRYTGLARFDRLHDFRVKRQILVMPTWRRYLVGLKQEDFYASEYYRAWQSLLTDPQLGAALKASGSELVFYLHYEMQEFAPMFYSGSAEVHIAGFAKYDVQALLKESACLVTDASSVYFDFAYMKKPILFYTFDESRLCREHASPTCENYPHVEIGSYAMQNELVNALKELLAQGFALPERCRRAMEELYPLHDQHNCDRIYEAVLSLRGKKKQR